MEQFRKSVNLSRSSSLGSRCTRFLVPKTKSQIMNSNLGENENFRCFNQKTSQFDKILNEFISKIEKSSEISNNDIKEESHKLVSGSIVSDDSATLVSKWLERINKAHYTHEFLFNGYDDINFITNIMSLEDLDNMGITSEQDVDDIIHSFESLPNPPQIDIESSEAFDATYLLNLCNLDLYLDTFIEQGYSTYDKISTLDTFTISVVLDVQYLGHRKRLMYYIDDALSRFEQKSQNDSFEELRTQATKFSEDNEPLDLKDSNKSSSTSSIE
ncbi:hypothetical protein MXB_4238 [Myxobolus squamalis]|nr:hypothetical protein MXB_4238 [Myxobolus squamalis]